MSHGKDGRENQSGRCLKIATLSVDQKAPGHFVRMRLYSKPVAGKSLKGTVPSTDELASIAPQWLRCGLSIDARGSITAVTRNRSAIWQLGHRALLPWNGL